MGVSGRACSFKKKGGTRLGRARQQYEEERDNSCKWCEGVEFENRGHKFQNIIRGQFGNLIEGKIVI